MNRADLYQMVWSEPVVHVARKIGMSDKGFANRCKSLRIPLPPRGYWAKTGSGGHVEKVALPDDPAADVATLAWLAGLVQSGKPAELNEAPLESRTIPRQPIRSEGVQEANAHTGPFAQSAAVSCELQRAVRAGAAYREHRDTACLLNALAVRASELDAGSSRLLLVWIGQVRNQLRRSDPVEMLIQEFSRLERQRDIPAWWPMQ